jgi:ATP-dependent RNA helicase DeaD
MTLVERTSDPQVAGGFAALRLGEPVQRALDEIGYSEPTPVQAATYPLAVAGRDIIVQARTGTGKTAAFGIPLVDKLVTREPHVQALVLAPTRELALQSQREIARIGQHKRMHVVAIYGGAPMGKQIEELQSGAQIVSGTPGRVLDHLRRGTFDPSHLRVLVLDEMDEMLSMGFAKELSAILELIPDRSKRQTMCFSATVDGEVRRHAERHMNDPEMVSLSSDAVGVEQITHYAYMVPGSDRPGDLVRILEVEDPESAIIFCNMRSETERVAGALKAAGFNADWLNGDLPQRDRERIMEQTRQGKLRYLVATDVAARGIDISHLTHVINYTFPESAAVYVHRTGRTGRAGRTGCAVSLVSPDELGRLYYLRLEYKISPIERSLPTRGELNTRAEADRILLLENAFSVPPSSSDLAIARRLLTHPEVERILGGLLHTFLGTHDEVDEEAAAVRRTRKPTPIERSEAERSQDGSRGRDESREGGRRRRRRGRDRGGEDRDYGGAAQNEARGRERGEDRDYGGAPQEGSHDTRGREDVTDDRYEIGRSQEADREVRGRDRRRADREYRGMPQEGAREASGRDRSRGDREFRGASQENAREARDRGSVERGGERGEDESRVVEDALREEELGGADREFGAEPGTDASAQPREREGAPRDRGRSRDRRDRDRGSRGRGEGSGQRRRDDASRRGGSGERAPRARDEAPSMPSEFADQPAGADDARDGVLFDADTQSSAEYALRSADAFEPPTARDIEPISPEDAAWDAAQPTEPQEHLSGLLYLNLGRRDGVRVNEVSRLLRDQCLLTRSEVGRIRVRDRYTYVDVPQERLDAIIESLSGHTFHDKTLSPERARVVKA